MSYSSHALNRHRTVNKREATESDKLIRDSPSSTKGKRNRPAPTIPPDLVPIVSRVVARINELAGTHYQDDAPDALSELITRLRAGASESDCLKVVDHQWLQWGDNEEMIDHFNPVTLFRKKNFPRYLQAALRATNGKDEGHAKPVQVKDLGNGMVEVDGRQIDRLTYERRYGQHANA